MANNLHNAGTNYLYFAEAEAATTAEAICVPASAYLSADPAAGATSFKFKNVLGTATANVVTLTHTAGKNKEVMAAMVEIMNSGKGKAGLIVVADAEVTTSKELTTATGGAGTSYDPAVYGTKTSVFHKAFNGLGVSAVAITPNV